LLENEETPWDSLKFMTGEITYGGRVTDDWDRVLLMTTLKNYYTPNLLMTTNYKFSAVEAYQAPDHTSIEGIRRYIEQLPEKEETEVYGMHPNSEIEYMRT
jgi:dynein heavy chain